MRRIEQQLLPVFTVAFIFGTLSVVAFTWVLRIERPSDALIAKLMPGKHDFEMHSGKLCVGGFQVDFQEEPGLVLLVRGLFRSSLHGVTIPARLFAGAYFNSLNQLVSANAELEIGGQTLLLALAQPKPVKVKIGVARGGHNTVLRDFEIPGPIEMLRNSDGTYRLSYVGLEGNVQRMFQQFSQIRAAPGGPLENDVRLVEGTADGTCGRSGEDTSLEAVNLDSYVARIPAMVDSTWVTQLAAKLNSAVKKQEPAAAQGEEDK